jgi:hypothetical protein
MQRPLSATTMWSPPLSSSIGIALRAMFVAFSGVAG